MISKWESELRYCPGWGHQIMLALFAALGAFGRHCLGHWPELPHQLHRSLRGEVPLRQRGDGAQLDLGCVNWQWGRECCPEYSDVTGECCEEARWNYQ